MQDHDSLVRLAPAKINLTLAILGRRDDGFHELESWVTPIALYDRLTFARADELKLRAGPSEYSVVLDESNLVSRAATMLAQHAGIEPRVEINLEKNIPMGAGLGGGSSDAATTLLALNEMWGLHWPVEKLITIAAKLGSDVPLFLNPYSAIIRGRGERVEKLSTAMHAWVALIIPPYSLATAKVYAWQAWRSKDIYPERGIKGEPWKTKYASPEDLMPMLFNDLETAAFAVEPRLASLHAQLNGLHGRTVRMTGSGSALFSLFNNENAARAWVNAAMRVADAKCTNHIIACNLIPS